MNEHETTTMSAPDDDRYRAAGAAVRGRAAVVPAVTSRQARGHQQRRRAVMSVAAVALAVGLLVTVVVLHDGGRSAVDTAGPPPLPAGPAVDWQTPTVSLQADGVHIVANGQGFTPPTDASQIFLHSDPGTAPPKGYTTLELGWQEHGVEMRINMYFKSDADRWWSDEIRIYDGTTAGEWIEFHGRYFDSPLGQPYTGSLQLSAPRGSLAIGGLRVQAFTTPAECAGRAGQDTLQSLYPTITSEPGAGFGAAVRLYDGTCHAVTDLSNVTFIWASDSPAIATVKSAAEGCALPNLASCTGTQGDIEGVAPGTTTVRVTANDKATGAVLATTTMQLTVR